MADNTIEANSLKKLLIIYRDFLFHLVDFPADILLIL